MIDQYLAVLSKIVVEFSEKYRGYPDDILFADYEVFCRLCAYYCLDNDKKPKIFITSASGNKGEFYRIAKHYASQKFDAKLVREDSGKKIELFSYLNSMENDISFSANDQFLHLINAFLTLHPKYIDKLSLNIQRVISVKPYALVPKKYLEEIYNKWDELEYIKLSKAESQLLTEVMKSFSDDEISVRVNGWIDFLQDQAVNDNLAKKAHAEDLVLLLFKLPSPLQDRIIDQIIEKVKANKELTEGDFFLVKVLAQTALEVRGDLQAKIRQCLIEKYNNNDCHPVSDSPEEVMVIYPGLSVENQRNMACALIKAIVKDGGIIGCDVDDKVNGNSDEGLNIQDVHEELSDTFAEIEYETIVSESDGDDYEKEKINEWRCHTTILMGIYNQLPADLQKKLLENLMMQREYQPDYISKSITELLGKIIPTLEDSSQKNVLRSLIFRSKYQERSEDFLVAINVFLAIFPTLSKENSLLVQKCLINTVVYSKNDNSRAKAAMVLSCHSDLLTEHNTRQLINTILSWLKKDVVELELTAANILISMDNYLNTENRELISDMLISYLYDEENDDESDEKTSEGADLIVGVAYVLTVVAFDTLEDNQQTAMVKKLQTAWLKGGIIKTLLGLAPRLVHRYEAVGVEELGNPSADYLIAIMSKLTTVQKQDLMQDLVGQLKTHNMDGKQESSLNMIKAFVSHLTIEEQRQTLPLLINKAISSNTFSVMAAIAEVLKGIFNHIPEVHRAEALCQYLLAPMCRATDGSRYIFSALTLMVGSEWNNERAAARQAEHELIVTPLSLAV